jgi:hypothetical protein
MSKPIKIKILSTPQKAYGNGGKKSEINEEFARDTFKRKAE